MTAHGEGLGSCEETLSRAYDVAMLDLDGVVYIGEHAVPAVPEHLAEARRHGMTLAFVTNNAARPPEVIADHLTSLGVPAGPGDVVTGAQAAARLLASQLPEGSPVFVIGGDGLFAALEEHRLRPVQRFEDDPAGVASGYHPDLRWRTVIDGAILVRQGLPWVVSNIDSTVPTPRGPGPGNGVLVGAVAQFAGVRPVVAGKPEPPLLRVTRDRVGGERPLVVGDRLDTDIEAARRAGYDSLLVMTGVTDVERLVAVESGHRPTYVAATLAGLLQPQQVPRRSGGTWHHGGLTARVESHRLRVEAPDQAGGPSVGASVGTRIEPSIDPSRWWQLVAAAAWAHLDEEGRAVDVGGLPVPQPATGAPER